MGTCPWKRIRKRTGKEWMKNNELKIELKIFGNFFKNVTGDWKNVTDVTRKQG